MGPANENNREQYNAHAEDWQEQMKTNVGHKYLEKPAMQKQLPDDLSGKDILSVGVGAGSEIDDIQERNPNRVVGIDISKRLLAIAKESHPEVEFKNVDMMEVADEFAEKSFDVIYSSLAFHYAKDWDALLKQMYTVLKDEGIILISTHNPEYWNKNTTGNEYTNKRGVVLTEHTGVLPGGIEIVYYNHPNTESIDEAFTYAGFTIKQGFAPAVVEIDDAGGLQDDYEAIKAKNSETPLFYIVKAKK